MELQLMDAILHNDVQSFENLLKAFKDQGKSLDFIFPNNDMSPLALAVSIADVYFVKRLLENGADPNFKITEYVKGIIYFTKTRYEYVYDEKIFKTVIKIFPDSMNGIIEMFNLLKKYKLDISVDDLFAITNQIISGRRYRNDKRVSG